MRRVSFKIMSNGNVLPLMRRAPRGGRSRVHIDFIDADSPVAWRREIIEIVRSPAVGGVMRDMGRRDLNLKIGVSAEKRAGSLLFSEAVRQHYASLWRDQVVQEYLLSKRLEIGDVLLKFPLDISDIFVGGEEDVIVHELGHTREAFERSGSELEKVRFVARLDEIEEVGQRGLVRQTGEWLDDCKLLHQQAHVWNQLEWALRFRELKRRETIASIRDLRRKYVIGRDDEAAMHYNYCQLNSAMSLPLCAVVPFAGLPGFQELKDATVRCLVQEGVPRIVVGKGLATAAQLGRRVLRGEEIVPEELLRECEVFLRDRDCMKAVVLSIQSV